MTDHSAICARDPPLHHRLDPFYPQPVKSGQFLTSPGSTPMRSEPVGPGFSAFHRLYLVIHADPCRKHAGSYGDPCDLPPSPYNLRPRVIPGSLMVSHLAKTGFCGDHGPTPDFTPNWQTTR
ncbi:hypothetical protein FOT80_04750 [Serratia fonticola]|nr:hypothetical protein [Serratia fonticola]